MKSFLLVHRLLCLVLLFQLITTTAPAQMRQVYYDTVSTNNDIRRISFYTPAEGYIASTDRQFCWVGYTADSGRTFTRKYITLSNVDYNGYSVNLTFGFDLQGVKAFSRDTLVAYGDYGFVPAILHSTNGGTTFKLIYHSQFDPWQFRTGITDMIFPGNGNTGYAVDADRILKTTNRGKNWSVLRTDPGAYWDYVEAADDHNVFVFSTGYATSKLLKTTNGGTSWQQVTTPSGIIQYTSFITPSKGWLNIVDNNQQGRVYYTENGGAGWRQMNHADITPFRGHRIKFVNDSTGYALGGLYHTFKTSDSGKVWQPLPRDNAFAYLNYGHQDLHIWNGQQLWAGGGRDFLELTTNGGGTPLPQAFFAIDTAGVAATGIVKLVNYSKPGYTYTWSVNTAPAGSSYHSQYTRNASSLHDSVRLIVSNGLRSDTLVRHVYFNPPVIVSSFTPTSGAPGNTITITGVNFTGATAVSFGGVRAASFTVVSSTQINAVVGNGASGSVTVTTPLGSGVRAGFTYYPPPAVNLQATVSDSLLCKAEPVTVVIQGSEPDTRYELISSTAAVFGSATGNGGSIAIISQPISLSGTYKIRASRLNVTSSVVLARMFSIRVEHTRSAFTTNRVNVLTGEPVDYFQHALEAQSFDWTFSGDASIRTSNAANPQGVSYSTPGQKYLTLVSTSAEGCRDTLQTATVFVYEKPVPDDGCYAATLDSMKLRGHVLRHLSKTADDGFLITAQTSDTARVYSRYGISKRFDQKPVSYVANYSTNGVLRWASYFNAGDGRFNQAISDEEGNIYILGAAGAARYVHLNDHDSIRLYGKPSDTSTYLGSKTDGFILKLDAAGNYLWHTMLYDPTSPWEGYPYIGGEGTHIAIRSGHVVVTGNFSAKLSYVRGSSTQSLFDFQNYGSWREVQKNFIIKIAPDGNLLWKACAIHSSSNGHGLTGISVDAAGNSYITGYYEYSMQLLDAAGKEVNYRGKTAYYGGYLVAFDAGGSIRWHNDVRTQYEYGDVAFNAVKADAAGNTYVTGDVMNWGRAGYIRTLHSNGAAAEDSLAGFVLLKFDPSGKRVWGAGSQYPYYGGGQAIAVKDEQVYVAGAVSNNGQTSASFTFTSTDRQAQRHQIAESEFFIAHYDTSGVLRRIAPSGQNTGGHINPADIMVDSRGNFLIGGNTDVYNGGTRNAGIFGLSLITPPWGDGFFAKLNAGFCTAGSMPTADAGPDKTLCAGDSVSVGAAPTSGYTYYWTSTPAGFTATTANPVVKPPVTTTYYLTVVGEAGLSARDSVQVRVTPAPPATAGQDETICAGSSITLGGTAAPGLTYSWTSDPAGFSATTAAPSVTPAATTRYFLEVRNAEGCTGKDTVRIEVSSSLTPSVRVSASATAVCQGTPVTFTAIPLHGGRTPRYQWKVAGVAAGSDSASFTTSALASGAEVSVTLTSSLSCATPATVASSPQTVQVTPKPVPGITISGSTLVTPGSTTRISAAATGGGDNPRYQWQDSTAAHSWRTINGQTANTLEYAPGSTGDQLRCLLTSSAPCAPPDSVASKALVFTVGTATALNPEPVTGYDISYYPNPAGARLYLDGLQPGNKWISVSVSSIEGKVLMVVDIRHQRRVSIATEGLPSGLYVATLRSSTGALAFLKFSKL